MTNPRDQETQVRQISVVLAEAKSEDGEAKEFGYVQNEGCGEETRTSGAVL